MALVKKGILPLKERVISDHIVKCSNELITKIKAELMKPEEVEIIKVIDRLPRNYDKQEYQDDILKIIDDHFLGEYHLSVLIVDEEYDCSIGVEVSLKS